MLTETGYCQGVENYSRHLSGRRAGEAPETLLSYFPDDFLTVIDESHVTLSQLAGMYAGDQSRKKTLIEHGFRLPSALDNRPLKFEEFSERVGEIIYTSATPGKTELEESQQIVEQIIRPTGLIDPVIEIRPIAAREGNVGQVKDLIAEAEKTIAKGDRVMITTLTKKMAEDLSSYLKEAGIKAEYLHSDVKTMDRIKVLTAFRQGASNGGFDCLVGVNLLREGLDLPEVSLIGILDADKEGFLRSETSLIQTIGRAARNVAGRVILYADQITGSLDRAVKETNRRREIQLAYNKKHGITPQTIIKKIQDITQTLAGERERTVSELLTIDLKAAGGNAKKLIKAKEKQMNVAVKNLDFETAAILRDEIKALAVLVDRG
jgi:excinuclease ABC subunit B